jgi:hypothetical protein
MRISSFITFQQWEKKIPMYPSGSDAFSLGVAITTTLTSYLEKGSSKD